VRSLAEAAQRTPAVALAGAGAGEVAEAHATDELEQIADFIYTRTS
jgi:hypothetical protein